jgi:hypothetical protein
VAIQSSTDRADFPDVAAAFVRTEKGGRALGRFVARFSRMGAMLRIPSFYDGATPAGAVGFFEAVTEAGVDAGSPMVKALVERLCGASQPERDRGALWTRALAGKLDGGVEGRAAILKKCAGTAAQTSARLKLASDAELGAALAALEGPSFDAALAAADGSPRAPAKRWEAIAAFYRTTTDAKKLEAVSRRFPPSAVGTAAPLRAFVLGVAGAEPGLLDAQKAALLGAGIERMQALGAADVAALVGELVGLAGRGKLPSPAMRIAVRAHAGLAPEAAKAALADVVREESTVLAPEWVLARADEKALDLFTFLDFNRARLDACTTDAGSLETCLSALPAAVPGVGRAAFVPAFVEKAIAVAAGQPRAGDVLVAAKALRAVGVDVKPLVDSLCASADREDGASRTSARASSGERQGHRERAEDLLAAAASLDADARCTGELRSKMHWRDVQETGWTGLRFLFLLVPVAAGAIYLRSRWAPVRTQLAAASREVKEAQVAGGGERRIPASVWSRAVGAGLADVAQALEGEASEDLRAAAALLRGLSPEARAEILKKARASANETMRTGDVTSVLLKLPGLAVYAVCFAGRAEQPQTVRRHAAFRDGWEAHAARVRDALRATDAGPLPLLGLLFFLHADAVTGTMLVALEGEGVSVVPERLLGEREARSRPGRVNRHPHDLDLAAGPAALPGAPEGEDAEEAPKPPLAA